MMDTCGAIVGPLTAVLLLQALQHDYARIFALTLIPGLVAALLMAFMVQERRRTAVSHLGFALSLRALPARFRALLLAVGLFGLGDFAHTMLILLAVQKLLPVLGAARAATLATALYVLHNVLYAAFAMLGGMLADRVNKAMLLAGAYFLAAVMALTIVFAPLNLWTLAAVFVLGGIYVALEETLEDSLCAELVGEGGHGLAFGTLATVNGIGDLVSSVVVGTLWTLYGTSTAFAYSAVLSVAGGLLVLRLATRVHGP
jgi:MFS family permease